MKALGKQAYRFEKIEFNPIEGCLRRDGQEFYLRQKLVQVLIYLIEQRHRTVTKDELIDNVWEGVAITDDALVQSIKDVRKALGDDYRQPRFIKTIPKIGYRFIAPVEPPVEITDLPVQETVTLSVEETESVEVEFTEESGPNEQWLAAVPVPPPAALPLPAPAQPHRSRTTIAAAIAALLLIVGAVSLYQLQKRAGQELNEVKLPQLPGRRAVAVMYFDNQSASADLEWLREGLADMLITNLTRSKRLTVLGREQLHLLLERIGHARSEAIRLDDAIEIARKSQVEVVILGSFARLGETIRINVHLYNVANGQPLASESIVADKPEHILSQIDLLSLKLFTHLGASSADQESRAALSTVMTNNLDAYRYYSLALEKAQAYHSNEAIELWEKATQLDPEFAMAYARIGYTYALIRVNERERAKPYLEQALRRAHRLTDKDKRYIDAWHAFASNDTERGIDRLREITAQYPHETEAYLRLGYNLSYLGRAEEAIAAFKQGLLFDPEQKDIHNALGFCYLSIGKYQEAIAAHRTYVQLAPNEPNAHDSLGLSYIEVGRYQEAEAAFEQAQALNPEFHFAKLHLGDLYFQLGRYREAVEQYRRFLTLAPSDWDKAVGNHRLVLLYLHKGDVKMAERATRQELQHKNDLGGSLLTALASDDLKSAEKIYEKLLADTGKTPPLMTKKTADYLRGCYAMKSGRTQAAIDHFKATVEQRPLLWNITGVEDCLANAYLELGRWDEAIAEYQRVISLNANIPLTHYRLAQALERKGALEQARASYQRFLQLWPQADADLTEVITARARINHRDTEKP